MANSENSPSKNEDLAALHLLLRLKREERIEQRMKDQSQNVAPLLVSSVVEDLRRKRYTDIDL